jgi:outer membrane protein OmpA-like peptidoglycan-associated protein
MIKFRQGNTLTIAILGTFVIATSGCVTKKYVSQQINPVNQRLSTYEKQTNDRMAWLSSKQQSDIAQVNERIAATDRRVSQVAQATSALEANEANSAARSTEEMEITNAANSAVASALNYRLVDKADVTFGFNKATLTPNARATLDDLASKFRSQPRAVVELAGFTDPIGSPDYNLGLSRRRAWAVQRYLVEHDVPLRSIHVVGMGEGPAPQEFDNSAPISSTSGSTEDHRRERRVNIRLFGAGEIAGTSGSLQ